MSSQTMHKTYPLSAFCSINDHGMASIESLGLPECTDTSTTPTTQQQLIQHANNRTIKHNTMKNTAGIKKTNVAPATAEAFSRQFYKTRLCPYHLSGVCKRGAACTYAHCTSELNVTPNLYKTKICPAWKRGMCTNTDCRFAHGWKELRSTDQFYKIRMCHFWLTGGCNKGDACRHAHGVDRPMQQHTLKTLMQRCDTPEHTEYAEYGIPNASWDPLSASGLSPDNKDSFYSESTLHTYLPAVLEEALYNDVQSTSCNTSPQSQESFNKCFDLSENLLQFQDMLSPATECFACGSRVHFLPQQQQPMMSTSSSNSALSSNLMTSTLPVNLSLPRLLVDNTSIEAKNLVDRGCDAYDIHQDDPSENNLPCVFSYVPDSFSLTATTAATSSTSSSFVEEMVLPKDVMEELHTDVLDTALHAPSFNTTTYTRESSNNNSSNNSNTNTSKDTTDERVLLTFPAPAKTVDFATPGSSISKARFLPSCRNISCLTENSLSNLPSMRFQFPQISNNEVPVNYNNAFANLY